MREKERRREEDEDELDPFYCSIKKINTRGERGPGDELDLFSYYFIKEINTGCERRTEMSGIFYKDNQYRSQAERERRPGDELDPFSDCFMKKINTGGRRRRQR